MPETGPDPAEQRDQELRALAREYLADRSLTTYCTNHVKVAMLAARLGSEDNWNAFATLVKIVWTDNPDGLMRQPWENMKAFLADLKKAVIRALRRAAREPGGMASIENIEQMLQSESPMLVCVGLLLRQKRGRIWHDDFLNKIRTDWRCDRTNDVVAAYDVNDAEMRKIMMWLMSQNVEILGHVAMRTVTDAVYFTAELDRRDVLVDHVKGVVRWDGTERLGELLTKGFGCAVDDSVGQTTDYLRAVGQNWMVSLIARALRPGVKVDTMPVFLGAQGAMKSSAMAIIGGPFFREISDSPANKDFYVVLQGCWLGEVAELASIASTKVEIAKVKAMLSRVNDHYRDPYGRISKDHLRRTVFAGTGNLSGWMRDESGGRRFWPVICGARVDLDWLRECREQLIAEAFSLYEEGATWWVVPEEAHILAVERQQQVSVYEEVIRERLLDGGLYDGSAGGPPIERPDATADMAEPARWGNVVTPLRIAVLWLAIPFDQASRHQYEITASLVRLGWRSYVTGVWVNGRSKSVRCWVAANPTTRQALRDAGVVGSAGLSGNSPSDQSDIPF